MQSWVEISEQALIDNFTKISKLADGQKVALCIKGNAYGHGMLKVAKVLDNENVEFFAVTKLKEALCLIENGVKTKILILSQIEPSEFQQKYNKQLHLTVYSLNYLKEIIALNMPVSIHLKVETGMNRQGINVDDLNLAISLVKKSKVELIGVSSHIAGKKSMLNQFELFDKAITLCKELSLELKYKHISNSLSLFSENKIGNLVRVGILLYGYFPDEKLKQSHLDLELQPVKRIYSKIIQVKAISRGEGVSYDHNFVAQKDMQIAVVPFGYYEGLPRTLSDPQLYMPKVDKFIPILGNICMNHVIVDVTGLDIKEGDVVEVLGEHQTADLLAQKANTINYEIITRFCSK